MTSKRGRTTEADDDFDSVFGESTAPVTTHASLVDGRGYGSWLAEDEIASKPKGTLKDPMKNILARKPPIVSPTIPRLEPDSSSLRTDPLDLDRIPEAIIPGSKPSRSLNTTGVRTRKPPARKSLQQPSTKVERSRSAAGGLATSSVVNNPATRLQEHFKRMEDVSSREQFSDTIEEWKSMLGLLEKLETIETAKTPKNANIISACSATMAWIADHLVDLILKRIQMRATTQSSDPSSFLTQIAQITALREQSRQSYLRCLHHNPTAPTAPAGPHHPLSIFIANLSKKLINE